MYQDIHLADKTLWNQFFTLWNSGSYSVALNILSNAQLSEKFVNADSINNIQTQLTDLQNNSDPTFKSDRIKVSATPPVLTSGQVYFKTI